MNNLLHKFNLYFCVISYTSWQVFSSELPRPRGVSLSKLSLYPPTSNFTCLDGEQTISFSKVNDDYCDCDDASDEPGTAACPNGVFHCANIGYKPFNIPSGRVNDGICDCCDGTDEYSSDKNCPNNCIELGRAAREEDQRRAQLFKAGKQIRLEYVQKGAQLKLEKQAKIQELQKTREEAERIRTEKEAKKKDAEELESSALEYYKKIEEEQTKRKKEEDELKRRQKAKIVFGEYDSNQDGMLEVSELQAHMIFDQDGDEIVSEEEVSSFLNNQKSVDFETFISHCWSTLESFLISNSDSSDAKEDMESDTDESADLQTDKDTEDDHENEDDEDHDTTDHEPKNQDSTVTYDEETSKLIEEANGARSAFQEADSHVRNIEGEIKSIEDYLGKDFGPEEEYAVLQGQCFEYHDNEYVYKLCPFDKTSQQPKSSSSSETLLGSWGKWSGPQNDIYEQMQYENGHSCWNGPQRSSVVRLNCGEENKITSVTEPNRCEYLFDFTTPAACREIPTENHDEMHDEL